jgi:hypothetical protein
MGSRQPRLYRSDDHQTGHQRQADLAQHQGASLTTSVVEAVTTFFTASRARLRRATAGTIPRRQYWAARHRDPPARSNRQRHVQWACVQAHAVLGAAGSAAPYIKRASGRGGLPQAPRRPHPPRHLAEARAHPRQLQDQPGVLLAPGILSPCRDHSQGRSLRSRPSGGATHQP